MYINHIWVRLEIIILIFFFYFAAVGELFHHYAEAWNYWHGEAKDKQQIEPGS